jgi:Putative beta-barrel porin 2
MLKNCASFLTLLVVLLVIALRSSLANGAETDSVRFNANGEIIQDDNLFRLPSGTAPQNGAERSDRIQRVTASVDTRAQIGLQTVSMNLAAYRDWFARNSFLNNTGHNVNARWNWQVGSNLSGTAAYANSRTLAGFGEQRRETRDLVTLRGPSLSANLKVALDHTFGVEASEQQTRRSDPAQQALENDTSNLGLVWTYRSTSDNFFGVRTRRSEAKYLNAGLLAPGGTDNFVQRDIGGFAGGAAGAVSRWSGELGYAKREYTQDGRSDFNGVVGRVGFDWQPTAKVALNLALSRQLIPPENLGTAYSVSSLAAITATWAATPAISVRATAEKDRRDYRGASTVGVEVDERRDNLQRFGLSASFDPITALRLAARLESGRRESNFEGQSYRYNQVQLGAELRF